MAFFIVFFYHRHFRSTLHSPELSPIIYTTKSCHSDLCFSTVKTSSSIIIIGLMHALGNKNIILFHMFCEQLNVYMYTRSINGCNMERLLVFQ